MAVCPEGYRFEYMNCFKVWNFAFLGPEWGEKRRAPDWGARRGFLKTSAPDFHEGSGAGDGVTRYGEKGEAHWAKAVLAANNELAFK